MTFYRYETDVNSMGGFDQFENFVHTGNSVDVKLREFSLVAEIPKGYWIGDAETGWFKKWIRKKSKKRYAYPSKEEALNSYLIRTRNRVGYLQRDLKNAEKALKIAEKIEL